MGVGRGSNPRATAETRPALGIGLGENNFLDVIEAERGLLEFRLAYYKAVLERENQLASLEQVVGTFF